MKIYTLTKSEYSKLKKLELSDDTYNTEAILYMTSKKNKWNKKQKVYKEFYIDSGNYFGQKLLTINSLVDNKELIDEYIKRAIIPDHIVSYNDELRGYLMDYVPSVNLSQILYDTKVQLDVKIKYLKEIGFLLENMKKLREYSDIKDFYINDLHEDNFIISKENKNIYLIDTDSCKLLNNKPPVGKMLTSNSLGLFNITNKYKTREDGYGTSFKPNEQTDLYCYTMIIMNFLYGKREVYKMTETEYYSYLAYLNDLGLNKELINVFENIYTNKQNINPNYLLDYICEVYPKTINYVYERNKR